MTYNTFKKNRIPDSPLLVGMLIEHQFKAFENAILLSTERGHHLSMEGESFEGVFLIERVLDLFNTPHLHQFAGL